MEHVLSDTPEQAGKDPDNYRKVYAEQIAGSDFYISGGLTELNYNIHSDGIDVRAGGTGDTAPAGAFVSRRFVMNIALDLRLIDTRSQEIRRVTAYQKQIVGREVKPGVFAVLDGATIDLSAGFSELEPIQLGVRTLVERSIFDFASQLYGFDPSVCNGYRDLTAHVDVTKRENPQDKPKIVYRGPYLHHTPWRSETSN